VTVAVIRWITPAKSSPSVSRAASPTGDEYRQRLEDLQQGSRGG
jgi:hypothetical protein